MKFQRTLWPLVILFCFDLSAEAAPDLGAQEKKAAVVGIIEQEEMDFAWDQSPRTFGKDVLEAQMGANPRQAMIVPLKAGTAEVEFRDQEGKVRRRLLYKVGAAFNSAVVKGREVKEVKTGEVVNLDLPANSIPNPTMGNKLVVTAVPGASPKQIKVTALKVGISSVLVYGEDGKVLREVIFRVR